MLRFATVRSEPFLKRFPRRAAGWLALVALLFAVPGEGSFVASLALLGAPIGTSDEEGTTDATPGEETDLRLEAKSLAWQRTREGRRRRDAALRHRQPLRLTSHVRSQRVEVRPQALPPRPSALRTHYADDDPDPSLAA